MRTILALAAATVLFGATPAVAREAGAPRVSHGTQDLDVLGSAKGANGTVTAKVRVYGTPAREGGEQPSRLRNIALKPGVWTKVADGKGVEYLLRATPGGRVKKQYLFKTVGRVHLNPMYGVEITKAEPHSGDYAVFEGTVWSPGAQHLSFATRDLLGERWQVRGNQLENVSIRGMTNLTRILRDGSRSLDGSTVTSSRLRFRALTNVKEPLSVLRLERHELELHFDGTKLAALGVIER